MGCGIGGGNWGDYLGLLRAWARQNSDVRVYVVRREQNAARSSPSPAQAHCPAPHGAEASGAGAGGDARAGGGGGGIDGSGVTDGTQRDKQRIEQLEAALRQSEERHASELAAPRRELDATLQEAAGKTGADVGKGDEDGPVDEPIVGGQSTLRASVAAARGAEGSSGNGGGGDHAGAGLTAVASGGGGDGSKPLDGGSAGDGGGGRSELLARAAQQRKEETADEKLQRANAILERLRSAEAKIKELEAAAAPKAKAAERLRQERDKARDELRRSETYRKSLVDDLESAKVMIEQLNGAEAQRVQESEASAGRGEAEGTPAASPKSAGSSGHAGEPEDVELQEFLLASYGGGGDGGGDGGGGGNGGGNGGKVGGKVVGKVGGKVVVKDGGVKDGGKSGLRGLKNLDNTCYSNSIMQLIAAAARAGDGMAALVASLRSAEQLLQGGQMSRDDAGLSLALADLMEQLDSKTETGGVVDTYGVFARFGLSEMSLGKFRYQWDQQDAAEFLEMLLEGLPTFGTVGSANAVRWEDVNTCGACGQRFCTKDVAPVLQVQFDPARPAETTLQQMIDRIGEPEDLVGGNRYACANCDKTGKVLQDATRRREYVALPETLYLHLVRFSNDLGKIKTPVT
jgi:hypothetical protein